VDGVSVDAEEAAIVAAVISLAHAMRLRAVAEGVETVAQVDRLRTLGCDVAQGYFFWRPVPAKDLTALLSDRA
jgi:diguanylate cyclase